MCALVIKRDLEYWGIDELALQPCCALRYYSDLKLCVGDVEGEEAALKKEHKRQIAEDFGSNRSGILRKYLWNLTEYPESSNYAWVCKAIFQLL